MANVQRLGTGRSSEFADTGGGGTSQSTYDIKSIVKTDGDFTSFNPLTGSTINFTTSRPGVSFLSASMWLSGFHIFVSTAITINVDGVDYTLGADGRVNGAGSDRETVSSVAGSIGVQLAAGSHTAYLNVSQGGLGIVSSPGNPVTLTVIFPSAVGDTALAATLVSQAVGPFAATVNPPDTNYIVIPSSSITVVLDEPQTVLMSAYTNFNDPGSNAVNGQLGIRRTSPGPMVVDYEGNKTRGGNDVNAAGSSLTRAVALNAGTHTFELIARNPASGGSYEYENTFLTVVYNNPQEVAPVAGLPLTKQEAINDSGVVFNVNNTTFQVIPSTTVNFNLNATQVVVFHGYATCSGDTAKDHIFGLRVDGVDYPGTDFDPSAAAEEHPAVVYRAIELGAGAHTASLVAKVSTGGDLDIHNNPDYPTVLTAVYTVPQSIAPVPFAFVLDAARTAGNFAVASGGAYMDVPGPLEITFDTIGGDALVEVQGLGLAVTNDKQSIGLGLKLDGVEQSGAAWAIAEFAVGPGASNPTTYKGFGMVVCQGNGINANVGSVGFKHKLSGLSAGTHTIRLTAVSDGQGTGSGRIAANTASPLRMTVWYN